MMDIEHSADFQKTNIECEQLNPRILIVDDNPNIHKDFKTILVREGETDFIENLEKELFANVSETNKLNQSYELDHAAQGQEGVRKTEEALAQGRPFMVAFVDMRMPPGWDGLETIERIWEVDPEIQVVICTAYSDYSLEQITQRLGRSDKLLMIRKPFDVAEIAQLASTLVHKWTLHQQANWQVVNLDSLVNERTRELENANKRLRQEMAERIQAEESLCEMKERWTSLTQNTNDIVQVLDIKGNILYMNKVRPPHQLKDVIGVPVFEFMTEESKEVTRKSISKLLSEKMPQTFEIEIFLSEQNVAQFEVKYVPILVNYEVEKIIAIVTDIGERKRVEKSLRESEERFRDLADLLPQSVFETDQQGHFTYGNSHSFEENGYSQEDIDRGVHALEMFPAEQQERVAANMLKVINGEQFSDHEYTIVRKDGTTFQGLLYTSPIAEDGRNEGVRGIVVDITDRKQSEAALAESEERFRAIFQNTLDEIVLLDRNGVILDRNIKDATSINGYTLEEIKGRNFMEFGTMMSEAQMEEMARKFAVATTGEGGRGFIEIELLHKNGDSILANVSLSNLEKDGEFDGLIVVLRDVTARRKAEQALAESEEKLKQMFEAVNDGVVVISNSGHISECNERALNQLGYRSKEEFLGASFIDLIPEDERERAVANFPEHFEEEKSAMLVEYNVLRVDGTIMPAEISVNSLKDAEGNPSGLIAFTRDVTERKRTQVELQQLATVVKRSSELVSLANLDGTMVFLNEAGSVMLGIDSDEVNQLDITEVIPDHLKSMVQNDILPAVMTNGSWAGDLQYRNMKTGDTIDVHANAFVIEDAATGTPLYLANVSLDITERKAAEAELNIKVEELQRYKKVTINRELKMKELKEKVRNLEARLG